MAAVAIPDRVLTVLWPTIGATAAGRFCGRAIECRPDWDRFRLVSRLAAFATIPISLAVFCWQLMPFVCRRYRLTTHGLAIQKGYGAKTEKSLGLADFDSIDVDQQPGQTWLRTADVVFRREGREVFRLPGVPSPQLLVKTCQELRYAVEFATKS